MKKNISNFMLSLSGRIVSKKNKTSLLHTIQESLSTLFDIDNISLFIIHKKEHTHYELSVLDEGIDSDFENELIGDLQNHQRQNWDIGIKPHFDLLKKKREPIIFKFAEDFINYPLSFSEIILAQGYRETLGALLQTDKKPFGIVYLNSKQKGELKKIDAGLYQQVAALISLSLSNILTHEEILTREQEKTVLLSLSEASATIRDKNELWKVMIERVKPLVGFKASVSTIYSEDFLKYCYFLFSSYAVQEDLAEELKDMFNVYLPIKNTSDD